VPRTNRRRWQREPEPVQHRLQLGTDATDPRGYAVRSQTAEGRRERPDSGLVDGGQGRHVEDGHAHRAAADMVCARCEVFDAVEVETAGQRHGEPAAGALSGDDELAVRASGRLMNHNGPHIRHTPARAATIGAGVPPCLFPDTAPVTPAGPWQL
jgi:hypothetical protein